MCCIALTYKQNSQQRALAGTWWPPVHGQLLRGCARRTGLWEVMGVTCGARRLCTQTRPRRLAGASALHCCLPWPTPGQPAWAGASHWSLCLLYYASDQMWCWAWLRQPKKALYRCNFEDVCARLEHLRVRLRRRNTHCNALSLQAFTHMLQRLDISAAGCGPDMAKPNALVLQPPNNLVSSQDSRAHGPPPPSAEVS